MRVVLLGLAADNSGGYLCKCNKKFSSLNFLFQFFKRHFLHFSVFMKLVSRT